MTSQVADSDNLHDPRTLPRLRQPTEQRNDKTKSTTKAEDQNEADTEDDGQDDDTLLFLSTKRSWASATPKQPPQAHSSKKQQPRFLMTIMEKQNEIKRNIWKTSLSDTTWSFTTCWNPLTTRSKRQSSDIKGTTKKTKTKF